MQGWWYRGEHALGAEEFDGKGTETLGRFSHPSSMVPTYVSCIILQLVEDMVAVKLKPANKYPQDFVTRRLIVFGGIVLG